MDPGSPSHAVKVCRRGKVPQRRLVVPQETPVFKHDFSQLVGGYRRSDWYACSDLRRFYG